MGKEYYALPFCDSCGITGDFVEHYHGYNHSEWVCVICGNDKLPSYWGFTDNDVSRYEELKRFLLFMKGKSNGRLSVSATEKSGDSPTDFD